MELILPREFYLRDTHEVAQELLGCILWTRIGGQLTAGKIVETESYIGEGDKASHSFGDKRTERTEVQYGPGGFAYIFLVYGMYYQFCAVTGPEDVHDVILVRALEPVEGIEVMKERRGTDDLMNLTTGPGKLCVALDITKDLYGADLVKEGGMWITEGESYPDSQIGSAKRVGVDYAGEYKDKLWRYFVKGNKFVSR